MSNNVSSIEEFIKSDKAVIASYHNMSLLEQMPNKTWITTLNVLNDYIKELKNVAVKVSLSWEEQMKYLYKPKRLCHDVYGNPELFFVILLLNDKADIKDFSDSTFLMLKKDHMNQLLSQIYNAEQDTIAKYGQ